MRPTVFSLSALLLALLAAGCHSASTTTTPSTTTPSTSPSVTETMAGVLPVGGLRFYSFSMATAGTVTARLTGIRGSDVPESVVLSLGIGTPVGSNCVATLTSVQLTGDANLTSVVTASQQPGTFCVALSDAGNLAAPATFTITIEHP